MFQFDPVKIWMNSCNVLTAEASGRCARPGSLPAFTKGIVTSCLGQDGPGQLIRFDNDSHTDSTVFTCCARVNVNSRFIHVGVVRNCFLSQILTLKFSKGRRKVFIVVYSEVRSQVFSVERDKHKDIVTELGRNVGHYWFHMVICCNVC